MEFNLTHNQNRQSLFFVMSVMFERMGFYGLRALLVLYMISSTFEMSNEQTMNIYGWFTFLIIFSKIVGALLGDFVIGNKNSVIAGGVLQAIGAFVLCIPSIYGLYSGLFLIVLGGGLYSPNLTANFGKLYLNQTKLLDLKFTVLFLFTNIGAFLGVLSIGFLAYKYNLIMGFVLAGILMLISVVPILKTSKENNTVREKSYPMNKKVINITFVFFFVALFWAIHHMAMAGAYDLQLHFKRILSSDISKELVSQIDLIVLIIASILAIFVWKKYYHNQFLKIAFAFIFGTVAFAIMIFLQKTISDNNTFVFLFSILFIGVAEVCIAPVILSILTKYVNPKYLASLISLSFIPTSLATIVISFLYGWSYENMLLALWFGVIAMALLGVGILIFLLIKNNFQKIDT